MNNKYKELVILAVNFKVALWMVAGRADIRSFGSNYDMSAVAAIGFYINMTKSLSR